MWPWWRGPCWPRCSTGPRQPSEDALARTLGVQLSILTGKVTRAERALLATRWPEVMWMPVPDVLDWYRQEILPRGGDHELQFAGSVLGHICWGTSQQRCRDKLNRDPYHLRRLLNQSARPTGPPVALHCLWLWIAVTAAWAARSRQEPVWAGVPVANRYPVDYPVAPPHLMGLISGSLRLLKASPALPEPA